MIKKSTMNIINRLDFTLNLPILWRIIWTRKTKMNHIRSTNFLKSTIDKLLTIVTLQTFNFLFELSSNVVMKFIKNRQLNIYVKY